MDIVTYVLAKNYTKQQVEALIQYIGTGLKYQGSVATVDDLPTPSESIKGHMYTVTETKHEWLCDGTKWIDLSDTDTIIDVTALPTTRIKDYAIYRLATTTSGITSYAYYIYKNGWKQLITDDILTAQMATKVNVNDNYTASEIEALYNN